MSLDSGAVLFNTVAVRNIFVVCPKKDITHSLEDLKGA